MTSGIKLDASSLASFLPYNANSDTGTYVEYLDLFKQILYSVTKRRIDTTDTIEQDRNELKMTAFSNTLWV